MINFKVILNVLGILLLALSALMLFPLMADLIKNNSTWMSFVISLGITASAGVTLILSTRDERNKKDFEIKTNSRKPYKRSVRLSDKIKKILS